MATSVQNIVGSGLPNGVWSGLDQSTNRLNSLNFPTITSPTPIVTMSGAPLYDKRVRISMFPNSPAIFYKDNLNPLLYNYLGPTNGVVFPFQPKVDISFSASYQAQRVTQSNFVFYNYENSELKPFDLTCDFPVRNLYEGQYVIAVMTFLRSLTMMFTGMDNNVENRGLNLAGSPPLVVSLQGMGFGGLDNVPIVISNVTTSYRDDVDYVTITFPNTIGNAGASNLSNEIIKLPTMLTISVNCIPVFSRSFASRFSTRDFSSGSLRLLGPNGPNPQSGSVYTINVNSGPEPTINLTNPAFNIQLPTVPTSPLQLSDNSGFVGS